MELLARLFLDLIPTPQIAFFAYSHRSPERIRFFLLYRFRLLFCLDFPWVPSSLRTYVFLSHLSPSIFPRLSDLLFFFCTDEQPPFALSLAVPSNPPFAYTV